jgi:hypothetical protein
MTLLKINNPEQNPHDEKGAALSAASMIQQDRDKVFSGTPLEILKKHIGELDLTRTTHFVTSGRWSMHDLLIFVLHHVGPSDVLVATWSISELAMRQILKYHEKRLIKSISFLLDPRVKVRNPKPLQLLSANFPHRLFRCHAKVTLIKSEEHYISIVSSANMTSNPRIERGVIIPDKQVYEFDYKWLYETINTRSD